jgi:hypothetical protein
MGDMLMLTLGLVSDFESKLDEVVDFIVDEVWKVNNSVGVMPEDFHVADPEEWDQQEFYDYIKPLVMTAKWDVIRGILRKVEIEQDNQDSEDEGGEEDETEDEDSEETDEADSEA